MAGSRSGVPFALCAARREIWGSVPGRGWVPSSLWGLEGLRHPLSTAPEGL